MVAVTLAVAVVSIGFLVAVTAAVSYLAFTGPAGELPGDDEDASTAD